MALKAIEASNATRVQLHIVLIEQAQTEYRKNLPEELQNLTKQFRTLSQTGLTLLHKSQAASWQAELSAIQAALSSLPGFLVSASRNISHDATCAARAHMRLARGIAPGRPGSRNVADCIISEHILELSRKLRNGGFTGRQVFVSSNIKDFGPIGQPKPPLDADFAALGIDYLPNIEAAMLSLGF